MTEMNHFFMTCAKKNWFVELFNCGYIQMSRDGCVFRVTNIADITEKIIPLFYTYPVLGEKHKDNSDFCKVLEMIK